jgi:uncharacterized protein (TIGR00369 family)
MEQVIEGDNVCFCCGVDNEQGLHLRFSYPREGEAEATLVVPAHFSGWKGITHGGFLSMLLDEAMAHACIGTSSSAVTGEMTVRFLKPVRTATTIRVTGAIEAHRGRILVTKGRIFDEAGTLAAEASAKFLKTGGAPKSDRPVGAEG